MVQSVVSNEVISKLIAKLEDLSQSKPDILFETFNTVVDKLKVKTGTMLTDSAEAGFIREALNVLFDVPVGDGCKYSNANYFVTLKEDDVLYFGKLSDIKRRTI